MILPAPTTRIAATRIAATRIATTTLSAAALLLGCGSGCGEVIEENKDLQMDRRQVDTYGDETPAPEAPEAVPRSEGG